MSLWVDKHKPKKFSDLDYHLDQAKYLENLVHRDDFPHILLYGPSGSGKKTRLMCIIRQLFGSISDKLKLENMNFQAPSGKKIEINVLSSLYHIEINPSDVGIYDRVVIQGLIKQSAQTFQLDTSIKHKFKVIVIVEAEELSKDAQHALRRTMEKYAESCRIILISNSISSIIDPIQSRCLCIRVASPNQTETVSVINKICQDEKINISSELAKRIYQECDGNLRRAIFMLECCHIENGMLNNDQKIQQPLWKTFIQDIACSIINSQSANRLIEIRSKLYEIISKCIPPELIVKELVLGLLPLCDNLLKYQLIQLAALYESRINKGSKVIFHLEAFVAHFMAIYGRFVEEGIAELF